MDQKTQLARQIHELRNKIHLCDGQRKSMFEEFERTKKSNEEKIRQLQDEVWMWQKMRHKDKKLVEGIYLRITNDSKQAKILCTKAPEEVKENLEQKLFMMRKQLDELRFQRKEKAKQLRRTTKDQLKELQAELNKRDMPELRKFKYLETMTGQLNVKLAEANYIKEQYISINNKLLEEQQQFKLATRQLEDDLAKYINEKARAKDVERQAHELRDTVIKEITNIELKMRKAKSTNERTIKMTKSKAGHETEEIKKASKRKSIPYSIKVWEDLMNQIKDPSKIAAEEKELASFIELFDEVRDKTGIATAEDIVNYFDLQKDTQMFLKEKEERTQAQLQKLREQKNELDSTLQHLNFKETTKYAKTFQAIEENEMKLIGKETEIKQLTQELEECVNIIANIRTVLEDIYTKLESVTGYGDVEIPQIEVDKSAENYLEMLITACSDKMLAMQTNYESQEADIYLLTPTPPPKEANEAAEQNEKLLVADELALNLDGTHTKYMTRNIIKQMSKQIIDSQTKMKKRMMYMPEPKSKS